MRDDLKTGKSATRARQALFRIAGDPNIPHNIKEDGCFERASAAMLRVRHEMNIPESDIGIIFHLNPATDPAAVLSAPNPSKPEAMDRLKRFLRTYSALTGLRHFRFKGYDYEINTHDMPVFIEYGLGKTPFVDTPRINWKNGHIAFVVDGYVVDPSGRTLPDNAVPPGVYTPEEWIKNTGLKDGLTFYSAYGKRPQLMAGLLSETMLTAVEKALRKEGGIDTGCSAAHGRAARAEAIQKAWSELNADRRNDVVNHLMDASIRAGLAGPYQDWTEFWVKATTTFRPGQTLVQEHLAATRFEDRVLASYTSLAPFAAYERMLEAGPTTLLTDDAFQKHTRAAIAAKLRGQSTAAHTASELAAPQGERYFVEMLKQRFGNEITQGPSKRR